jgi:hypothetical protein
MRRISLLIILLSFFKLSSFCQGEGEELIDWKGAKKLTWTDYKGQPQAGTDAAAATTTYLGIEYLIDEKGFTFKIQCRFSKTKSWGKSKTDYILEHEQGHFDIAEIFARKLNKNMSEYKFNKDSFRKDLKSIYDSVAIEKENFQNQYDLETDHSRKKDQQAAWNLKIKEWLTNFEKYSGY